MLSMRKLAALLALALSLNMTAAALADEGDAPEAAPETVAAPAPDPEPAPEPEPAPAPEPKPEPKPEPAPEPKPEPEPAPQPEPAPEPSEEGEKQTEVSTDPAEQTAPETPAEGETAEPEAAEPEAAEPEAAEPEEEPEEEEDETVVIEEEQTPLGIGPAPATPATPAAFTANVRVRLMGDGTVYLGDTVTLMAVVDGANRDYHIRWEMNDGSGWATCGEGQTYTFTVTEINAGFAYRAVAVGNAA